MKTYLLDTFNRYKRYSEKLDAKTILCNKSWWVFNDLGEKETYIFQEDGTLIIALSGKVSMGTWQYLPVNQSVIISGNNQSYLVLPSFVDGNILALQIDGTNEYAFLIDENNKSNFKPNTYTEVVQYFENKEKKAIEAKLRAEQEEKRKLEIEQRKKDEMVAKIKYDAEIRKTYYARTKKVSYMFNIISWIFGTISAICYLLLLINITAQYFSNPLLLTIALIFILLLIVNILLKEKVIASLEKLKICDIEELKIYKIAEAIYNKLH